MAVKLVQIPVVDTCMLALFHVLIDSFITLQVFETRIRLELKEDQIFLFSSFESLHLFILEYCSWLSLSIFTLIEISTEHHGELYLD